MFVSRGCSVCGEHNYIFYNWICRFSGCYFVLLCTRPIRTCTNINLVLHEGDSWPWQVRIGSRSAAVMECYEWRRGAMKSENILCCNIVNGALRRTYGINWFCTFSLYCFVSKWYRLVLKYLSYFVMEMTGPSTSEYQPSFPVWGCILLWWDNLDTFGI